MRSRFVYRSRTESAFDRDPKMSSEQDQVVVSASASSNTGSGEAPARRRIVVAQKPSEKPIAFISREPEQADAFEEHLGRVRNVVVFPSLTHFCTDPSRAAWGGVVIARSCGWDARLLGFVPSPSCIAFWGAAEEGYGWPASIRKLDTQDDVRQWVDELARPLPFQLPRASKRSAAGEKRGPVRRAAKPQLKFELATARGVVDDSPVQMELDGLPARRIEPLALNGNGLASVLPPRSRAEGRPSTRPGTQPVARASERPATDASNQKPARAGARAKAASEQTLAGAVPVARRRGRPPAADKQPSSANPFTERRLMLADVVTSSRSAGDERDFMKIAAELGLARAAALLGELRARAHSLRR